MTHMSLARRVGPDYASLKILALVILAIVAFTAVCQVVLNFQFVYAEDLHGFELRRPQTYSGASLDSVWIYFCGFAGFASILSLSFGIAVALSFKGHLGSGLTRASIWILGLRSVILIAAFLTLVAAIIAGICTAIDPHPSLTAESVSPWAALPVAGASYLFTAALGYVVALAFIAFHWMIGLIGILAALFIGPRLAVNINLDTLFNVHSFGTLGVTISYLAAAVVVIAGGFILAKNVKMRR